MRAIGTFAMFIVLVWGATYVPFTDQYALNLVTAPQQTVRVSLASATEGEISYSRDAVEDACNRVPFLMRPIARRPQSTKLVLTLAGEALGEMVISCGDGSVISEKVYE